MPGNSTTKLLKYLPKKYNKNPGVAGTPIIILGAGNPVPVQTGASNIYQLCDAAGFTLDTLFQDITNAKQETYIGIVPIAITLSASGTIGSANTTVDICYSFNITTTVPGLLISLPPPTSVNYNSWVIVTNTGTYSFSTYGFSLQPGQTLLLYYNASSLLISGDIVDNEGNLVVTNSSNYITLNTQEPIFSNYNDWRIGAHTYYIFNPQTGDTVQTLSPPSITNPNDCLNTVALVFNLSSTYNVTCYGTTITPNTSALFIWNATTASWTNSLTNYLYNLVPAGADSQSGNQYLGGNASTWLDNVGRSFGDYRFGQEDDNTYKNQIHQMLLSNKVTKLGIQQFILTVFGLQNNVYNWSPQDYVAMLATLNTYQAYDLSGNSYSIPLETHYPNYGVPCQYYVVIKQTLLPTNNSYGFFADYSFLDFPDGVPPTTPNYYKYGGFLLSESSNVNSDILNLLFYKLSLIQMAGTAGIVVLTT
jgi:hypothetical protein